MPRFEGGGPRAFRKWIARYVSLRMPQAGDVVRARFVIVKDGSMSELEVKGGDGAEMLADRVDDAFAAAPRWTPAVEQGERVCIGCSMKLQFGAASESSGPAVHRDDDDAYLIVETMPRFKGGNLDDFRRWLMGQAIHPPEALSEGITERVAVMFVVETDGSITHIRVLESPHRLLTDAVVETLSRSPKWMPGKQDGPPVRVKFTLPVDFSEKEDHAVPFENGSRTGSASRYDRPVRRR